MNIIKHNSNIINYYDDGFGNVYFPEGDKLQPALNAMLIFIFNGDYWRDNVNGNELEYTAIH